MKIKTSLNKKGDNVARVWLVGDALESAGFSIGDYYKVRHYSDTREIVIDLYGTNSPFPVAFSNGNLRKVSKSKGKPVIDLQSAAVFETLNAGVNKRVLVSFGDGVITVRGYFRVLDHMAGEAA